ncbi:MAG: hypothetical protein R3B95_18500 [Nitrospirales bacterium]|nr:hypothetical protein [Nitrospirales bacterium]
MYLFYGRPAYGSKLGAKPSTSIAYCPVCFVFKPYTISKKIARIFPFDSGASKDGLFEPHLPRLEVENFQLSTTLESARRATDLFFETNYKYYLGEPKQGLPIPATEKEAHKYYCLISHEGDDQYDDRRSVIEVQISTALTLRDTLLAVILPLGFLEESYVRKALFEDWRTYPITYSTVRGTIPAQYGRVIADKLQRFLKDGAYL